MVRTLISLRHTHTGFVASEVTTGEIYLPNHAAGFFFAAPTDDRQATTIQRVYEPLLNRVRSMPGVQSAGLTTVRPLQGSLDFNMTVELNHHREVRTFDPRRCPGACNDGRLLQHHGNPVAAEAVCLQIPIREKRSRLRL